jgi:23S rRNA (uridine2552-2'-O)-methyltransferase
MAYGAQLFGVVIGFHVDGALRGAGSELQWSASRGPLFYTKGWPRGTSKNAPITLSEIVHLMAKKKSSSNAWLKEHRDDIYVQRAQREGYRSRACYKLLELQEKDRIIRPGMTVLDLGSAPGGWSQVAAELVGHDGRVIASDILAMDNLAGVEFIKGDFTEDSVFEEILAAIGDKSLEVVVSDMAPNMSGMSAVDLPRAMYLVELALDMARQVLAPGGVFITKVFQGEGFEELYRDAQSSFARVVTRKPKASRARSKEVYLVAKDFTG